MLQKIKNTLAKYQMLKTGDRIVVGVSGGPDSVALLHALLTLRSNYQLSLFVVHLDHQLRGKEAQEDSRFVAELAKRWSLPFFLQQADVQGWAREKKLSIETAAREIRYQLYEEVADKVGAARIALGHNADDQAETILMRLLRGAGEEGLAGIPPVRGKIIRPLWEITRGEIEAYCQEQQLAFRLDSTNLESIYLRNKIRLKLLPFLEREYNSNIRHTLLRLGQMAREDSSYWQQEIYQTLKKVVKEEDDHSLILDWSQLLTYHPALQKRVLREVIKKIQGNLLNVSFTHLEDCWQFFFHSAQGKKILPSGVILEKSYNQLIIKRKEPVDYAYPLQIPGVTRIPEAGLEIKSQLIGSGERISKEEMRSPWRIYLTYDPDQGPLLVRNRRPGDVFRPWGLKGSKKLKEFFIDAKIPRFQRERVPLLAQNQQILWIIGERLGEDEKKKPTLLLEAELLEERRIKYD